MNKSIKSKNITLRLGGSGGGIEELAAQWQLQVHCNGLFIVEIS